MQKAVVFYHYLYPDDVISARHLDGLCTGLAAQGWCVIARPCNRGARNETLKYPLQDTWDRVTFRRVWRPPLRQSSILGRLCNAAWMIGAWSIEAHRSKADVLIIGTDPIMSVLVARVWKLMQPKVVIAHWCYDLYPEAAIADGMLRANSLTAKALTRLLRPAYRACDLIVDIGSCMRDLLRAYGHHAMEATLVPWALYEPLSMPPVDQSVRQSLFGNARLGLMYSGNFGKAHSYADILELARMLRGESIRFSFGVRGNAVQDLIGAINPDDTNITMAPFAPESQLQQRLCAPDIHLVSLKLRWTGTVVPSKFFGSLAVGRPVIFAGSQASAVAGWIREHQVGWVLDGPASIKHIATELGMLSRSPATLDAMKQRCHRVYQENFSKVETIKKWDRYLRELTLGKHIK